MKIFFLIFVICMTINLANIVSAMSMFSRNIDVGNRCPMNYRYDFSGRCVPTWCRKMANGDCIKNSVY